jgi:hypothetical protein
MKTFIDSAVNKAATIYLQDSNTNGISIGVYFKGLKYTYNYGEFKRGRCFWSYYNNRIQINNIENFQKESYMFHYFKCQYQKK